MLGMKVVFQNNYPVGIGGYGNAIATRLPVVSQASHPLPNARERRSILRSPERRGVLEVLLDTPAGALTVLTTHWSLHATDRLESAGVVADRVRELRMPVLLCGDFNAEPASDEVRLLIESTGLIDTAAGSVALTFPSDSPAIRIDYVFRSASIHPVAARVITTQASDHLPFVVEW